MAKPFEKLVKVIKVQEEVSIFSKNDVDNYNYEIKSIIRGNKTNHNRLPNKLGNRSFIKSNLCFSFRYKNMFSFRNHSLQFFSLT